MRMPYWKTIVAALTFSMQVPAFAAPPPVKLYKNPNCGCCDAYADELRRNGFNVTLVNMTHMSSIKKKHGVTDRLEACHTAIAGGYVFEGLIPVKYVKQVLNERKPMKGLSLPGMPVGVPGMPGRKRGTLTVYYISDQASPAVYATF